MSSFGSAFGGAQGASGTGGSFFGQTSTTDATGTGIFGTSTAKPTGTGPFGYNPTNTGTAGASTSSNPASGSGLGTSVFGAAKPTTGFGTFGGGTSTATLGGAFGGTSTGGSAFGGLGGTSIGGGGSSTTTPAGGGGDGTSTGASSGGPSTLGSGAFGMFGSTNTTTGATNPPATSIAPSLFGASAAKPTGTTLFSNPASTAAVGSSAAGTGASTGTPSTTSNLFSSFKPSGPTATSANPAALAAPSTTSNLFSSLNTPTITTTASTGATTGGTTGVPSTTATGATTSLFGPPKTDSTEKREGTATTAPAASTLSTGIFGATKSFGGTATASASTGATPFSLSGLGNTTKANDKSKDSIAGTTTAPAAAPTAVTGTTPSIVVPTPSVLRGKTIEEIVNCWSSELDTHVRDFNNFAGEVAVWDRALIENANDLNALHKHVMDAEREQNEVDQSLDHIEQQQRELASTLEAYEKNLADVLGSGHGGSVRALENGLSESERDKSYLVASELHAHLEDLSGSLTQMIESVNSMSVSSPSPTGNGSATEDPMAQIAQILSSHLESLQWIDGTVRELEARVIAVDSRIKESGYGQQMTYGAPANGGRPRAYGRYSQ